MKKIGVIGICFLLCFSIAGCGTIQNTIRNASIEWKSDGREYGEEITVAEGSPMETVFFRATVNTVTTETEIEGYVPEDEEHIFLVVNLTIENIYEEINSVPMFCDDFELTWEALAGETTFPEYQFYEEQLPDEYTLNYGESRTGNLVFIVPKEETSFQIKYYELWEDNFVGNIYYLPIIVKE